MTHQGIYTDEYVIEKREEWNPEQFEDEPEGLSKDVLLGIATKFHSMSIEEYREVLKNTDHD